MRSTTAFTSPAMRALTFCSISSTLAAMRDLTSSSMASCTRHSVTRDLGSIVSSTLAAMWDQTRRLYGLLHHTAGHTCAQHHAKMSGFGSTTSQLSAA